MQDCNPIRRDLPLCRFPSSWVRGHSDELLNYHSRHQIILQGMVDFKRERNIMLLGPDLIKLDLQKDIFQSLQGITRGRLPTAAFEDEQDHAKSNAESCSEVNAAPWWKPARKWIWVLWPQGSRSSHNHACLEKDSWVQQEHRSMPDFQSYELPVEDIHAEPDGI